MYLLKISRVRQDITGLCFFVIILNNNNNDEQDNHSDNNENYIL